MGKEKCMDCGFLGKPTEHTLFDEKVNLRFRKAAERAFYCFTGFSGTITKAAGSGQRQRPDE